MDRSDYSLYYMADKKSTIEYVDNLIETINIIYKDCRNSSSFTINTDNTFTSIGLINDLCSEERLKKILGGSRYCLLVDSLSKILFCEQIDNIELFSKHIEILKYFDFYRKKQLEAVQSQYPYTMVDLFCGAGGMSLGFSQEGFRPLLAIDIEKVCCQTYFFNHFNVSKQNIIVGDIKDKYAQFKDMTGDNSVDILIGGPPCQSFSMANRQRIIDDPRNYLYKYYLETVKNLLPKIFIMENVKGMLPFAEQIIEDFKTSCGYNVSYHIFNAKDFSIPQNRERIFFIGVRHDLDIIPQNIIENIIDESKYMSTFHLIDAINDLKPLCADNQKNKTDVNSEISGKKIDFLEFQINNAYTKLINNNNKIKCIYNHKARYNNERDIEIFSKMHQGDKADSPRIKDIMPYNSRQHIFKDKYYKLKENDICKTITAHMKFDCNMYIHPTQARGLTPREAARVQSFPDDYFFLGAYTKTFMQIGNSVPPLLSRIIAKVIKQYL